MGQEQKQGDQLEGFGSRLHADSLDWDDEKWLKLGNMLKMQHFGVTDTLDQG